MGVRDVLVLLGLLSAAVLTEQELLLSVSPDMATYTQECVTLHCNVSSSKGGLLVKYLSWTHNNNNLCIVEDDQLTNQASGVECNYADQRLSLKLTMPQQSQGSNDYICKLRSNQGPRWRQTSLKLKDHMEPYNCSRQVVDKLRSGTLGPQWSIWRFFMVSVLLMML